jgi:alkylation response protein AidB-like acyl-CoA dehydrogenase
VLAEHAGSVDRDARFPDDNLSALAEVGVLGLTVAPSHGGGGGTMAGRLRAAFRKELGIERRFRDARAARVMAPTTEALLDFVGRALTGLPLLDEVNA